MNKKMVFAVICFILSIISTLQMRTIRNSNKQIKSLEIQMRETIQSINDEKKVTKDLNDRINQNLKRKEEYLKNFDVEKEQDVLKKEWEYASKKAGLTDVTGSGVIMTLKDAPLKINAYEIIDGELKNMKDMRNFIIHDIDIVNILNELKIHGSYAMSINDERIISTSEQICVGPTVRVNKKRCAAPYIIKAIGDSNKLFSGINNSKYVNFLRKNNLEIDIRKDAQITVFKYRNDIKNLVTGLEVVESE